MPAAQLRENHCTSRLDIISQHFHEPAQPKMRKEINYIFLILFNSITTSQTPTNLVVRGTHAPLKMCCGRDFPEASGIIQTHNSSSFKRDSASLQKCWGKWIGHSFLSDTAPAELLFYSVAVSYHLFTSSISYTIIKPI